MSLVLTRRSGQSIRIGDDITITVSEVSGGAVRVSIDAPRTVPVNRTEVLDAIAQSNAAATGAPRVGLPTPAVA